MLLAREGAATRRVERRQLAEHQLGQAGGLLVGDLEAHVRVRELVDAQDADSGHPGTGTALDRTRP